MEQQDDSKVVQIVDNSEHFTSTFMDVLKDLIKRVERLESANTYDCYSALPPEIEFENDRYDR